MEENRNSSVAASAEEKLVITRVFVAPGELVWKAWTGLERNPFKGGHKSMQQGFSGTLDQLAAYLA